jgi:GT2 family glycosyltransferase
MEPRSVDLFYLACNRLEFTQETFAALVANTDWAYVRELVVYDDGSVDGTREWLSENVVRAPVQVRFVQTQFGSPVVAMSHFIERAAAPILAKCDNDAMYPPGWLRQSLDVLDRRPELALLGIEAMYPHSDDPDLPRGYVPAEFISGLGLYRRAVFQHSRPRAYQKWFGLEEWQMAQGRGLTRGWINPALPVFLLDRFPLAPWCDYSDRYIQAGWQRAWPRYPRESALWQWRWPTGSPPLPATAAIAGTAARNGAGDAVPGFSVVVLSANAANLVPCVESILANEPALPPSRIIVVDDGARAEAAPRLPAVRWITGAKPFVFARNANLGIRAAGTDVFLVNDDARLVTPQGFTALARRAAGHPHLGVCSAAVRGVVGNPRQQPAGHPMLRMEPHSLAFVCAFIPAAVYATVGPLDERFTGYGFEDNDYCTRVLAAGLRLAIADCCVVDHGGELPSSFRTRPDIMQRFHQNRQIYQAKWGRAP